MNTSSKVFDTLKISKLEIGPTWSDKQGCVACVLVWEQVRESIEVDVKGHVVAETFENICADQPSIFYDAVRCY